MSDEAYVYTQLRAMTGVMLRRLGALLVPDCALEGGGFDRGGDGYGVGDEE
jgi:hypothetical protein